ncbi:MAG: tRNA guanosine(34) transglycosylase Tgt [Candidatus Moranbacteria bacterium]|nr:tRNA guanosine(34) transglycosylase Tgt [Candidatus Moranbacteria bacterium]
MLVWQQQKNSGGRRVGMLTTKSGVLQTPFFMPDATRATVRGVTSDELKMSGTMALVVNTYHLMLQPGESLVRRAGGVHTFMHWDRPILSDSGGYQVYSLIHKNPQMGRITEEGAEFRSVLDGTKHLLTPERAIQIQFDLDVDMMVVLDDPRPNSAPETEVREAVKRTLRWAQRSKTEYEKQVALRGLTGEIRPLLFGVVQGGMFREERKRCVEGLVEINFDGYGFGGRHIDMEGNFLEDILLYTASLIPEDSLRFALGVGTPEDIARCHALGWDMFDCVIPTREGRHGRLFVWKSEVIPSVSEESRDSSAAPQNDRNFYTTINISNAQYEEDFSPVDPTCDCELCTKYTRAYLKHLFKVGEPLAARLASLHNLRFYAKLMDLLQKG